MWSVFKGLMVFKLHRGRRSVPPGRLLLSSTFPCKDTSLLGVSFRGCGLNIKSTLRSSHFAFLNVRPLALLWTFWLFPEVIKSWWIFRCSTSISWDSLKRLKLLRCLQEFTVVTYRQQCIVGYYRKWKPHTRCMLSWHYALKKSFLYFFSIPLWLMRIDYISGAPQLIQLNSSTDYSHTPLKQKNWMLEPKLCNWVCIHEECIENRLHYWNS